MKTAGVIHYNSCELFQLLQNMNVITVSPVNRNIIAPSPFSSKPLKLIRVVTFPGNPSGMNISCRPRLYTRCATNRDFNLIHESIL